MRILRTLLDFVSLSPENENQTQTESHGSNMTLSNSVDSI